MNTELADMIIKFRKTIPDIPPKGARGGKPPERIDHRFWRQVNIKGPHECWDWMGCVNSNGRGAFTLVDDGSRKTIAAYRYAHLIANDAPIGDLYVCHHCDNPRCCNPSHLYAGTPIQNKRDCITRGRLRPVRGEDHFFSKLTNKDVLNIRELRLAGATLQSLADKLGVSIATVHRVVYRKTWMHV